MHGTLLRQDKQECLPLVGYLLHHVVCRQGHMVLNQHFLVDSFHQLHEYWMNN